MNHYILSSRSVKVIYTLDVEKVMRYALEVIYKIRTDISVEPGSDESANASFDPTKKLILIHFNNLLNTIVSNLISKDLTWEETVQLILYHEVGHADPRAQDVYPDDFEELVDSTNALSRSIHTGSSWLSTYDDEDLQKSDDLLACLNRFHRIVEESEIDAYIFGKEHIPPYLQQNFSMDNYNSFSGYKEENNRRLYRAYKIRYDILEDLSNPELRFDMDKLFQLDLE